MPTTLDPLSALPGAAHQSAVSFEINLGRAIFEVAREGLSSSSEPARTRNRFPVFCESEGARSITLEDVQQNLDDET